MAELQPLTPPSLDRLVRRCLAKDPEGRWQSANDLADELKWIAEAGAEASGAAPAGRPASRTVPIALAAVIRVREDVAHRRHPVRRTDQMGACSRHYSPSSQDAVKDAIFHLYRAEGIDSAEVIQLAQLIGMGKPEPDARARTLSRSKAGRIQYHAPHRRRPVPRVKVARHRQMQGATGEIDPLGT